MTDQQDWPRRRENERPTSGASDAVAGVLDDMFTNLRQEAAATRMAVENRAEQQRKVNRFLIAFIGVMSLVLVGVLVILLQNRSRSLQNGQVLRNQAQTNETIADCTKPTGTCYRDNQERTAALLRQLMQAQIYVQQCADSTTTDAQLQACVSRKLVEANDGTPLLPSSSPRGGGEG